MRGDILALFLIVRRKHSVSGLLPFTAWCPVSSNCCFMYSAWFLVCSRPEDKAGPIITSWLHSESFEQGRRRHIPRVFQPHLLADSFYLIHQEARVQPSLFPFIGWETEATGSSLLASTAGSGGNGWDGGPQNSPLSLLSAVGKSWTWESVQENTRTCPARPPPPHSRLRLVSHLCSTLRFTEHFT